MKNNRLLPLSGGFLILTILSFAFYMTGLKLSFQDYGGIRLSVLLLNVLVFALPLLLIALYCFGLHNTKAGNLLYYAGFGLFIIKEIWQMTQSISIPDCVLLLVLLAFMAMKRKPGRGTAIFGASALGVYAAIELFLWARDLSGGYITAFVRLFLLMDACSFFQLAAFFLLWWNGRKTYFVKKKASVSSLEKDLMALKALYEAGKISEQEYRSKRAELLNRI